MSKAAKREFIKQRVSSSSKEFQGFTSMLDLLKVFAHTYLFINRDKVSSLNKTAAIIQLSLPLYAALSLLQLTLQIELKFLKKRKASWASSIPSNPAENTILAFIKN